MADVAVLNTDAAISAKTVTTNETAETISGVKTFSAAPVFSVAPAVNAGLKFPSTEAPQADVNTLDDYEEGTFTPAITFGGASVGVTYATQAGNYTKIGNRVTVEFEIALTSNGTSTGDAAITGLPFNAAAARSTAILDCPTGMVGLTGVAFVVVSSATLVLLQTTSTARTQLNETHFSDTANFRATLTYRV